MFKAFNYHKIVIVNSSDFVFFTRYKLRKVCHDNIPPPTNGRLINDYITNSKWTSFHISASLSTELESDLILFQARFHEENNIQASRLAVNQEV